MEDTEECFEMFPGIDFAEEEKSLMKEEMNGMLKNMDKEELKHFFSKEEFDENYKLIELNNYPFEKSLMLLKHVGHENAKKPTKRQFFTNPFLKKRFGRVILEEEKKKEGKDEKLLINLCECFLFWGAGYDLISNNLMVICMHCFLIAAMNKEESEEKKKETELALLALSCIDDIQDINQEQYLNEIKEVMKYHLEHHNLTRLAYQSAWQFLIKRLSNNKSLEEVITNELYFVGEARRELEELVRNVDWKKTEEDKRGKEKEETMIIKRWMIVLNQYFYSCKLRSEEHVELAGSVVQIFRAGNDNDREIGDLCVYSLKYTTFNRAVNICDLLKKEVAEIVLSKMNSSNEKTYAIESCVFFFKHLCERLNEKMESEGGESERENEKAKRKETEKKVFEKMEEEGYEDCIVKMRCFKTVGIFGDHLLIQNIEDYYLW